MSNAYLDSLGFVKSPNGHRVIVVTRHQSVLDWLEMLGYPVYEWVDERDPEDGGYNRVRRPHWEVISHVEDPAQVRDVVVIGNVPMHIAAEAVCVGAVEIPDLRPDQRGRELTMQEMADAGARLRWYHVQAAGRPSMA